MRHTLRRFFLSRLFLPSLALLCEIAGAVFLAIYLPLVLAAVTTLERLFSLIAACIVLRQVEPYETKCSRLLLILLLPYAGAVLCFLWRAPYAENELPALDMPPISGSERALGLGAVAASSCGLSPCYATSAEYFVTGEAFLDRYLRDLGSATRSIYLEYYLLDRGEFLERVLSVLKKKASEGVDVRLIADDFGCSLTLSHRFFKELGRSGIKAFSFEKIGLFPSVKLNRRDHRKIAIIDSEILYLGGFNLADEYIGKKIRFGHWKDAAIRLTGDPARRFLTAFDYRWRAEFPKEPVPIPEENKGGDLFCVPFVSSPSGEGGAFRKLLFQILSTTQRRVYLTTPYLVPDGDLIGILKRVAEVADVRILIPHIPDKKSVFALSRSYARELQKAGVRIREYAAGFLHAKNIVSDGEIAAVSSCNLDFRSLYAQYESGVILSDPDLAKKIESDFLSDWEQSVPVKAKKFDFTPLRLFAPLM